MLLQHFPSVLLPRECTESPEEQLNFACCIHSTVHSLTEPIGTHSPRSFVSPSWTTDLLLLWVCIMVAEKQTWAKACILFVQIRSCTQQHSTTSLVQSQSYWGIWAYSTTAWRVNTCPPGLMVSEKNDKTKRARNGKLANWKNTKERRVEGNNKKGFAVRSLLQLLLPAGAWKVSVSIVLIMQIS